MGIEYKENKDKKLLGRIEYKMKNIHFQNKQCKLHKNLPKPVHIYYDDDGNVCDDETSSVVYCRHIFYYYFLTEFIF